MTKTLVKQNAFPKMLTTKIKYHLWYLNGPISNLQTTMKMYTPIKKNLLLIFITKDYFTFPTVISLIVKFTALSLSISTKKSIFLQLIFTLCIIQSCRNQTHPPKAGNEIFFFFYFHGSPFVHLLKVKIKLCCLLSKIDRAEC